MLESLEFNIYRNNSYTVKYINYICMLKYNNSAKIIVILNRRCIVCSSITTSWCISPSSEIYIIGFDVLGSNILFFW